MRSIALSRRQALGGVVSGTLAGLFGCGKAKTLPAGEQALTVIEPYLTTVNLHDSEAAFRKSFAAVPPRIGHLIAVSWCDAEVCNGGFHQFFLNSTGVLAPEAVLGFRAVGLEECADLVEIATGKFPAPYPRDHEQRNRALDALSGSGPKGNEWNPFHDLDSRYYAAKQRGGYDRAVDAYAQQS